MPFDPMLVERIRPLLSRLELHEDEEIAERKMFGGVCFTLNGKMLVGVEKNRIVVRTNDEEFQLGLADGSLFPMDLTGKPMRNFAFLNGERIEKDEELLSRIEQSVNYVRAFMFANPSTPQ